MEKTLYPSRVRAVAFLVLCLVGVRLGVMGNSWLLTIGAAAGVAVFSISLIPGAGWLKLDEQGFTFSSLFRRHRTRWEDVGAILVVTQRQMGIPVSRMVSWTYPPSYRKSFALRASRVMVDVDALLPDTYGMKAADLAALMDAWRQRAGAQRRVA